MPTIRDYDAISKRAKEAFASEAIPRLLAKYPDLDAKKLSKTAQDFFDIFCNLNQVHYYNKYNQSNNLSDNLDICNDTRAQWQYYTAFFYRKLSSDSALNCVYKPKELDYLELTMSCPAEETMGLPHHLAGRVLGSMIREAMDNIRNHFNQNAIFTNNLIPSLNKNGGNVLATATAPQSSPVQLAATSPSAPAHAQALSTLGELA